MGNLPNDWTKRLYFLAGLFKGCHAGFRKYFLVELFVACSRGQRGKMRYKIR